jgi:hypothetical protein
MADASVTAAIESLASFAGAGSFGTRARWHPAYPEHG